MKHHILELKNWHLGWKENSPTAFGALFDDSSHFDGTRIQTDEIKEIEVLRDGILLHVAYENYFAKFAEHRADTRELSDVLPCFFDKSEVYDLVSFVEIDLEILKEEKNKKLLEVYSKEHAPFVTICLSDKFDGFADCFIICTEEKTTLNEFSKIQTGLDCYKYSVADRDGLIYFSYSAMPEGILIGRFWADDTYDVFVFNSGSECLNVFNETYTFTLAPGEAYQIQEMSFNEED